MSIKSVTVGGRTDIKKITIGGGTLFEKQTAGPSNQLIPNPTFSDTSFWVGRRTQPSGFTVANNIATFVCFTGNSTTGPDRQYLVRACAPLDVLVGHTYYFGITVNLPKGNTCNLAYFSDADDSVIVSNVVPQQYTTGQWSRLEGLITIAGRTVTSYTGDGYTTCFVVPLKSTEVAKRNDTYYLKDGMCVDLTAMYGAGNEPTLAEFRAAYPLDSYPYTPLT